MSDASMTHVSDTTAPETPLALREHQPPPATILETVQVVRTPERVGRRDRKVDEHFSELKKWRSNRSEAGWVHGNHGEEVPRVHGSHRKEAPRVHRCGQGAFPVKVRVDISCDRYASFGGT